MHFTALDILQPSVLLGWRGASYGRSSSSPPMLAPLVNPLLRGSVQQSTAGIPHARLRLPCCGAARSGRRGMSRYSYDGIARIGA